MDTDPSNPSAAGTLTLRKNPPFEVNPNEPFKGDELQREPAIKLLTTLIQSTSQPFVLAVEAPWGWGKTKFVEMWKAHLQLAGHFCLHFNAWENDFVADPLVAFVGELKSVVESATGGKDAGSPIRVSLTRLQKFGGTLTKKGAPILVKALVTKALGNEAVKDLSEAISESAGDVADLLSETAKKRIEHYEEEKSSIQGFRKALGDLAAQLAQQPDKRQQLIFFVDELDRCRPDFAMTLLERIKHLFNVERVVFVLSVDRQQLRNTVQHLYGCGENADVYLRRFIDLSYQLPKPAPRAFVSLLISRMHLTEFLSQRANGQTEAKHLERYFIEVVDWLDLDLRTQEQCFTRLNAIIRLWKNKEFVPTDFLAVMVGLKVGRPQLFDQLRAGKTVMRDHLPKGSIEVKHLNSFLTDCLEVVNGQSEHFRRELESLRKRHGPFPDNAADETTAIRYKHLEYFLFHRDEVLRLLDFSADLR